MKQKILLLLSFVLLFSCSSKEKYILEYKLSKGDSHSYAIESDVTSTQSVVGQGTVTKMKMDTKIHYNVTDVREQDFTLEMIYDALRMSMSMDAEPMGSYSITYDSNTEETVVTSEDMGPMLKAITGIPFVMKITKKGKIESVEGIEKMKEAMVNAMGESVDAEAMTMARESLTEQLSNQMIAQTFEQLSAYLPEKPVGIGDSWKSTMTINSNGINSSVDMKLKLTSVENNIAVIKVDGIISTPESSTLNIQKMKASVELSGTQAGTVHIDMNTGWPIKCNLDQNMSGSISMMGMSVPMEITAKTVISKQ